MVGVRTEAFVGWPPYARGRDPRVGSYPTCTRTLRQLRKLLGCWKGLLPEPAHMAPKGYSLESRQTVQSYRQRGLPDISPSHIETVYVGVAGNREPSHSLFDADSHLRDRRSDDNHALFRLYNAATPVKVRQLVGMTFDQWASSPEQAPGRPYEGVLQVEDDVQGWLRTSARSGKGSLAVRLRPDYDALMPEVVEAGLRRLHGTRTVFAIVEEYAPRLATALEGLGFEAQGEYVVLVKSVARRVLERLPGRSSQATVE